MKCVDPTFHSKAIDSGAWPTGATPIANIAQFSYP